MSGCRGQKAIDECISRTSHRRPTSLHLTRTVAPERQQSRESSYRAAALARLTGNGGASRVTLPALHRQASNLFSDLRALCLCLTGQSAHLLSVARPGKLPLGQFRMAFDSYLLHDPVDQLRPARRRSVNRSNSRLHRPVARHHQPATTSDRLRHSVAFRLSIVTDPSQRLCNTKSLKMVVIPKVV